MSGSSPTQSSGTIAEFVQRARRLYSLPAVAMEVLELTNNPQVDTAALKACIENDPALTTKILRIVNSSLFGLSDEVSDLNQALALLGTKPLKLFVLGFSLPSELFANIAGDVLGRYWRHTLTKAVAGRELSETVWNVSGDEPFIAGLLQNLGMLVLLQDLGEPYVKFIETVHRESADQAALELATLGFDHVVLSARLLEHWRLPKTLVRAVALSHSPDQIETLPPKQRTLPQILHLSNLIALLLAQQRSDVLPELIEVGRRYHDLSREQLETLVGTLQQKVNQLADVLSLTLPDGTDYGDVLTQAHIQLADAADDAAGELVSGSLEDRLWHETESLTSAVQQLVDPGSTTAGPDELPDIPTEMAFGIQSVPTAIGRAAEVAGPGDIDPGFLGQVAAAVAGARQTRCPLSLLLVQIDNFDDLIITRGVEGASAMTRLLEAVVRAVNEGGGACLPTDEAGFAAIWENCDRQQGVELGRKLVAGIRDWSKQRGEECGLSMTVSAGVATVTLPPKNFPAQDLIEAAQRCLYAAQSSGGDGLKSIGFY